VRGVLRATVVDRDSELARLIDAWDELAVAAAEPLSTPAWMLAWWRHAAPAGAVPHVVAVRDGERLVGLAPFWHGPDDDRHLDFFAGGSFSSSVAVLAVPGREVEVAAAVGGAFAGSERPPQLIELGPAEAAARWPAALRDGWTGGPPPLVLRAEAIPSPVINLEGIEDLDAWVADRGRSFRSNFRRRTRQLERDGGAFRECSEDTLVDDVATFARLHNDRWRNLGTSRMAAMGDALPAMLVDLGRDLGPGRRFRLYLLEVDGHPIAASLLLEAGGEVALINTGWDEDFHQLAPLQLLQGHAVADGLRRGDRRINLGRGASRAKLSAADGDEPVIEAIMVPWGPGTPAALVRARRFVRRCAQERVREAMPDQAYDRLRTLKRRVKG
jgi:CelD/BcsL family acetyltransferase involved in cellulose biosynthesis